MSTHTPTIVCSCVLDGLRESVRRFEKAAELAKRAHELIDTDICLAVEILERSTHLRITAQAAIMEAWERHAQPPAPGTPSGEPPATLAG